MQSFGPNASSGSLQADENLNGIFLLCIALGMAVMTHGALLPFTHGNTYDAYIHMFFGEHYARSWFDPWEPRWYTGFATTSYPPGTHMMIAALLHLMPIKTPPAEVSEKATKGKSGSKKKIAALSKKA